MVTAAVKNNYRRDLLRVFAQYQRHKYLAEFWVVIRTAEAFRLPG